MSEYFELLEFMKLERDLRKCGSKFCCFGFAGVQLDCYEDCPMGEICIEYRKLMAKFGVGKSWIFDYGDDVIVEKIIEKEGEEEE